MTEQTEPIEEFTDSTSESTEEVYETADMADDSDDYIEVSSGDELWDELDLGAHLTDSSDEESYDTDDAEVDDDSYDDTAFPSEDEVADADTAESEFGEEEPEEVYDEDLLSLDLDRPAPLSRRKAERVVKGIIEPLRDPNTPISDVLSSLAEFHPTRTQQLAETIVSESVNAFPDEWLKSITGLDITVNQVKEWAAMGGREPSNPAPATELLNTDASKIAELNDLYGDDWRNPAYDEYLLEDDIAAAQTLRAQPQQDSAFEALQKELEATKAQLHALQPQIENIKQAQQAEYEQAFMSTLTKEVEQYRSKIEANSIPKVLESKNLLPKDSDSEEVKAVKTLLGQRFQGQNGYGSEFDIFLESQFSGKDSLAKGIKRVGDYLTEAAKLETEASRQPSAQQAQIFQTKAKALKEQAMLEQDALTVWTRKATAEFLESPQIQPILELLQTNADLQRRLSITGRPEIIGQTAAVGTEGGFRTAVQKAKESGVNPFDVDISGLLGGR
jgi:hypothetical protein